MSSFVAGDCGQDELDTAGPVPELAVQGLCTPAPTLDQRAGAYLGLLAAIGIAYGGYKSMREESGTDPEALDIETVRLQSGS